MSWLFEDDICWCANSDMCSRTECFRHMSNMSSVKEGERRIYTAALLLGTEDCLITKEEKYGEY